MRKRNGNKKITRYKARLVVVRIFTKTCIVYEETYFLVVDKITLRFLIDMTMYENQDIHIMDVVTTYLYGSLDNDIYTKVPE